MYTRFDVVGDAERRAKKITAARDRTKYTKFAVAALKYVAASPSALVGGDVATRMLLGDALEPNSIPQYLVYAENGVTIARGIADAIYAEDPDGLGHYAGVMTAIADYKFLISVDGRDIFTVIQLPKSSGSSTARVLTPSAGPVPFANIERIRFMSADLRLIEVYATLCDPRAAGDWAAAIADEQGLRRVFISEARGKIRAAVAGGAPVVHRASTLRRLLRDRFVAGPGRVLVGAAAIAIATGRRVANQDDRLQIVSLGKLEAESVEIVELLGCSGVTARIDNPNLAVDPRLRRLTIHFESDGRREALIDVYNSAGFEAIPWQAVGEYSGGRRGRRAREPAKRAHETSELPTNLRIGTPYVLMRYRLIDFWIVQLLLSNRVIGSDFAKGAMYGILSGFEAAAELCDAQIAKCASESPDAVGLLPITAYVGRIEDCALALRRKAATSIRRQYYPQYFSAAAAADAKLAP